MSCGDLPPEYLASIREQLDVPLYYVRGNHDIRYQNSPPVGCLDIHQRRITFKGLRIMGLRGITLVQRRTDSVPGQPDATNDLAYGTGVVVEGRRGYGSHPRAASAYPRCGRPMPPGLRQLFNAHQPIQTPLFYPWPHSRPLH